MPSMKRPGNASARVRAPAAIAKGSRAQMLAIPVATTSREVAPSRTAACESASRLAAPSAIHSDPKPRSSTAWATLMASAIGNRSRPKLHAPTLPRRAAAEVAREMS